MWVLYSLTKYKKINSFLQLAFHMNLERPKYNYGALRLPEKQNKELGDENQNRHLNIIRQNCYRQLRLANNMIL